MSSAGSDLLAHDLVSLLPLASSLARSASRLCAAPPTRLVQTRSSARHQQAGASSSRRPLALVAQLAAGHPQLNLEAPTHVAMSLKQELQVWQSALTAFEAGDHALALARFEASRASSSRPAPPAPPLGRGAC